ncbi:type III secretion protein [Providencia rettgeri]|uniref:InvB/SpaK family type III secretion system chaperone n=1 Tax=Providencia rettgeri TaxID=587 RepID=UPI0034E0DF53
MYTDLAELVTSAINHIGREDVFNNSKIDNHSAITISFHELPDVNIFVVDEMPMIWAIIEKADDVNFKLNSDALLSYIMDSSTPYFHFGQPALLKINDNIELRAAFTPLSLQDGESMSIAINIFVSFMNDVIKLYK